MLLLAKSVFNWDFDLQLPRHGEIALSEFVFCFILLNITFAVVTHYKDFCKAKSIGWVLCVLFCLYAFWDTDYFSFANNFKSGLENFRDPLYTVLAKVSFGSYVILRLWVWGTGVLLYYLLSKRLNLPSNLSCYVFALYFLTTFCYARVSLGMAIYFYGLSFLLIPSRHKLFDIPFVIVLFAIAFYAHRSIVLLISLTPLVYFKMTKWRLLMVICSIIVIVLFLSNVIISYIQSAINEDSSVGSAAAQYMKYTHEQQMNWKYWLMTTSHYCSFYIAISYVACRFFVHRLHKCMPKSIVALFNVVLGTLCVALLFLSFPASGFWIIGYRFLYMTGIPLCVIITYMYAHKLCTNRALWLLMACSLLYSEGFIFGKILSLA